jgi:hypothetical protein
MSKTFLVFYSVIATAVSVLISVVAYRAGGPRVTIRPRIVSPKDKNYLSVEIGNNGRSAITIDIVGVELFYFYGDRQIREHTVKPEWDGPSLPFRLEGHSSEAWRASADFLSTFVDLHDQDNSLKLKLKLGGRRWNRTVRVKIADPILVNQSGQPL